MYEESKKTDFEVRTLEKKIILTGGGSAGHVMVNLALIPKLKNLGWSMRYIGSESGIEKELIQKIPDVPYYSISTGKLRRYFDWKNFKDPFRVIKGVYQAYSIIKKEKPQVVFSKGGFVSVPVIMGAWLNKVPAIIHESDFTPGLANKLSVPFATKVCTTFPETEKFLPKDKTVSLGAIIREELQEGKAQKGYHFCEFTKGKPVILVMGGSLGAKRINEAVRNNLDELLKSFQIVHLCGKGHVDPSIKKWGYQQYEYINEELPDILAMTDLVISRAGANAIHEFLALKKPMILIPLSRSASRGDQILNAESFQKAGYAEVIQEEELTDERLLKTIQEVQADRGNYISNMVQGEMENPLEKLLQLIKEVQK